MHSFLNNMIMNRRMMVLALSFILCHLSFIPAGAQTIIGYLSYDSALHAMHEYATVQRQLSHLRTQYEKELKRAQDDFNKKYEEFLEGQHDFPATILRKRQTELRELMEKNVAFKAEGQRELQQAEEEALKPLQARLSEVLARIARERGYIIILNTDSNACPYIDPQVTEDINQLVIEAVNRRTITRSQIENP